MLNEKRKMKKKTKKKHRQVHLKIEVPFHTRKQKLLSVHEKKVFNGNPFFII